MFPCSISWSTSVSPTCLGDLMQQISPWLQRLGHEQSLLSVLTGVVQHFLLATVVWGTGLKQSTALSQATMAGGAIAGVLYGLFCSNPTKPHLPVVSFRLALELGPPLILGTSVGMLGSIVGADGTGQWLRRCSSSLLAGLVTLRSPCMANYHVGLAGVLANPLVPDWLLVILLTVVLLLLASRVALRAARMHAAESALLHPPDPSDEEQPQRALSDLASAKSGILSPFQRVANVSGAAPAGLRHSFAAAHLSRRALQHLHDAGRRAPVWRWRWCCCHGPACMPAGATRAQAQITPCGPGSHVPCNLWHRLCSLGSG